MLPFHIVTDPKTQSVLAKAAAEGKIKVGSEGSLPLKYLLPINGTEK